MLADMVSVVGRVEDISVVEQPVRIELGYHALHQLIDSLKGLESPAVIFIRIGDLTGVELGQIQYPAGSTRLIWSALDSLLIVGDSYRVRVEVFSSGNPCIGKSVRVSLCRNWIGESWDRRALNSGRLRVRRDGSDPDEERAVRTMCLLDEAEGTVGDQVGRVAIRHSGSIVIALEGRVPVAVGGRVHQDCKSRSMSGRFSFSPENRASATYSLFRSSLSGMGCYSWKSCVNSGTCPCSRYCSLHPAAKRASSFHCGLLTRTWDIRLQNVSYLSKLISKESLLLP